jgi:mobilization protein NikA
MPERRTAAKLIRFRPEELARITARARDCGRTPACFIRETALGAIPRPRPNAAADPLLSELARVGRRLDQLARLAQAGQDAALAQRVRAALDEHWTLVRRVVKDPRRGPAKVTR